MARSMTGFGKAVVERDGETVTAEISSVNHRYLDCQVRLPSSWSALEQGLKQSARDGIARGKVTVTIDRKRAGSTTKRVQFDESVARQYIEAAEKLGNVIGMGQMLSIDTIAQFEGVFYFEESEEHLDNLDEVLNGLVGEALERLNEMRAKEGAALARDVQARIAQLRGRLDVINSQLPEIQEQYETRLRQRIDELNTEPGITEERVSLEIAIMAEKADVTEEVVRLNTHFDHAVELLEADEPIGRKLDFLCQEIQREINTLGVKTRDSEVAKEVIAMKSELEKIREQVQNVE